MNPTTDKDAWDQWFDIQYDIAKELQQKVKDRTQGKSDAFRAAVCCGIMETLAEDMRIYMELPTSDAQPVQVSDEEVEDDRPL